MVCNNNKIVINRSSNQEYSNIGNQLYLCKRDDENLYIFENNTYDILRVLLIKHVMLMKDVLGELDKEFELNEQAVNYLNSFLEVLEHEDLIN